MKVYEFHCTKHLHPVTKNNLVIRYESHEKKCPLCAALEGQEVSVAPNDGNEMKLLEQQIDAKEIQIKQFDRSLTEANNTISEQKQEIEQLKADNLNLEDKQKEFDSLMDEANEKINQLQEDIAAKKQEIDSGNDEE